MAASDHLVPHKFKKAITRETVFSEIAIARAGLLAERILTDFVLSCRTVLRIMLLGGNESPPEKFKAKSPLNVAQPKSPAHLCFGQIFAECPPSYSPDIRSLLPYLTGEHPEMHGTGGGPRGLEKAGGFIKSKSENLSLCLAFLVSLLPAIQEWKN